jgi:hypothetical protein
MAWYNDLWNSVTGQTDFKAGPYRGEWMDAHQGEWLGGLQQQAQTNVVSDAQRALAQEAAMNRSGGYGRLGDIGNAIDPSRTQGQLETVAGNVGNSTLRQSGAIEGLATELGNAPSVADATATARMGQLNSDAMARAASTRGANANLQMREAADANASAGRQLAADAAAMKTAEMANRYGQRAGMIGQAAGITQGGAAAQGSLLGAAGQSALAANQAKAGIQSDVMSGMRQEAQLRQNAYTTQGNLGLQQQQNQTQALGTGLTGATQGQGIVAGSRDAANAANAQVQSQNATNKGGSVGGMMAAAGGALAMLSDVRAKEDIEPVGVDGADPTARALRRYETEQTPASFRDWKIQQYQKPEQGDVKGGGGLLGGIISDKRSKTDVDPIARMAASEEANRDELDDVKPYSYRYKGGFAERFGQDRKPRVGVMAQDLEKGPAGREVVFEGPGGLKALDTNRAVGYSLAGLAGLDKRMRRLEGKAA